MKRTKFILKILTILPCVLILVSCQLREEHASNSILLVVEVAGHTDRGDSADFLQSDVFDNPPGTFVSDIVSATLEAKFKAPENLGIGTSYKNRIFIHTYEVRYTYIDSNLSPLPSPSTPATFQGRLSVGIDIDSSASIEFVIVREQAKTESPLWDVVGLDVLQVVAQVTFYGDDIAGHPVQATGYLTIYFADYADD